MLFNVMDVLSGVANVDFLGKSEPYAKMTKIYHYVHLDIGSDTVTISCVE